MFHFFCFIIQLTSTLSSQKKQKNWNSQKLFKYQKKLGFHANFAKKTDPKLLDGSEAQHVIEHSRFVKLVQN